MSKKQKNKKTEEQKNKKAIDNVSNDIEVLRKKSEEYLQGWQRAKADYANLKKEQEARFAEFSQYSTVKLISEMLPVFTNLEEAIKFIPEDDKNEGWVKGIEHIHKQFSDVLENLGLKRIETVGKKFDPSLHEAVESKEVKDKKSDEIIEEVKAGYTFNGKTLIATKVKVVK